MFMICYDGSWIQWLFCDQHIMLECGSRLRLCCRVGHLKSDSVGLLVYDGVRTYLGHLCDITSFSGQYQPYWEWVNILDRP
jgi:hypothetical protein